MTFRSSSVVSPTCRLASCAPPYYHDFENEFVPVEYPFRNYLLLFGASAKAEVVNYVRTQCIPEEESNLDVILRDWTGANSHFKTIEQSQTGEAEKIGTREIPAENAPEIKRIEDDPLFKQ